MRFNLILISLFIAVFSAMSQARFTDSAIVEPQGEPAVAYESLSDSLLAEAVVVDTVFSLKPLPRYFFLPFVFSKHELPDTTPAFTPNLSGNQSLRWLEEELAMERSMRRTFQNMVARDPSSVNYVLSELPEPPKEYVAVINPIDNTVTISEKLPEKLEAATVVATEVAKRHWIKTFNASLQFSQAYLSPNWYQGGNNALNAQLNLYYNVKLNPQYHSKILFENTFQYKLGINSAPDDTLRAYNVSEDILQVNSIFGIKAVNKWYYSLTGMFKTQLVNSYQSNTNNLRSAFLSPGELNIGLGMTYNTVNAAKTFTFDASISPLSYNLKICTNSAMNVTAYGIAEGRKAVSKFGSSAECKLSWKISYNISLASRLFGFTDYDRFYADWENTLMFEINRFLTTQIFVHLRYDNKTPRLDDNPHWKKLQVKEILSLGFAYKFSTT